MTAPTDASAEPATVAGRAAVPWRPCLTPPTVLLLLLLAADTAFVALHLVTADKPRFDLTTDRGYSETFQYVKEYWIAGLLVVLALRRRTTVFAAWAALFFYLLIDDSMSLHERGGAALTLHLGLSPVLGIRAQDVGELLVSAAAGSVLLGAIAVAHRRAHPGNRPESTTLVRMVAALVAFGVGVDVVHEMLPQGFWYGLFAVLEDGGEMVVMSFLVAFVFEAVSRPGSSSPCGRGPTPGAR